MTNLQNKHKTQIIPSLLKDLSCTNEWQLPRLEKIVVNFGLGEALKNSVALEKTIENLKDITGQAPVVAKARKAISNFNIREGDKIGVYVTLRGDKMWDFLDKLVNFALPRVKDFRGVSNKSFDESGNYSLGLKEQTIFSEVELGKIDKLRSFELSIVIKNSTKEKSYKLLSYLGMPFVK